MLGLLDSAAHASRAAATSLYIRRIIVCYQ